METWTLACSDMSSGQERIVCGHHVLGAVILLPPGRRVDVSEQLLREGNAELLSECVLHLISQIKLMSLRTEMLFFPPADQAPLLSL